MSRRATYAVRISGLGEGHHNFSFELDRQFFALFEHPDIENGHVHAEVMLEKKAGVMSLHFSLNGEVEVVCDRCLEKYFSGITSVQSIFVKTGDTPGEIEEDVLMIGRDDHEIDVGQYLFEFIVLALPYQKIHPDDMQGNSTCDPDMLKHLDAHSYKETEQDTNGDPRWDALKGIIE